MTGGATFGFDHCMLIKEWPSHPDMAFGTHHELPGGGGQRILSQCPVRVMAVSAVDQSFLNLMVEGRGELRLHLAVALEAKLGLIYFEQISGRAGGMNDVTADATYIALAVDQVFKV